MKNYLWERGIQLSDGHKGKKTAKLFDLRKKAATMKQIQIAALLKTAWSDKEKLLTSNGKFLVPKILDAWMHNFCNFPEFVFGICMPPDQV